MSFLEKCGLVRRHTPLAPGVEYKPVSRAAKVGGDFYDLGIAEEGKIFFFIGDVSGKDLAQAITADVAKFSNNHLTDDVALVILRRTG